ncbi:MAG TPA: hypothetical protein VK891_01650 [Euzebyales bacterium]|nr:hypothetical protein [Euzebyales bacterium]
MKHSRRSFLRHTARVAALGAGGLIGVSASSAKACAIYCRYQYTDNTMGDPCLYKRVYYCTSVCDGGTFEYCTSSNRGRGFCLSQNVC